MKSLFLENAKKYQEFKENNYEPPFYKVTNNIFVMILCVCAVVFFVGAITGGSTIAAPVGIFTFFVAFLGINLEDEPYWKTLFDPLEKAEYYIVNHIYSDDISKLFNLECIHTVKILKEYATQLEENIYKYKGLSGDLALEILNKVIRDKKAYNLERKKIEEKEIIKSKETKTGKMLNDIENIKRM